MTVFVQFAHPRDGFLYIDPRDIIGYRTRLNHDDKASPEQGLTLILRNGVCESVHQVSIAQINKVRALIAANIKTLTEDRVIPFEKLLEMEPS